MAGKATHRGGKKNRKHGRNKKSPAMARYAADGRAEKNKARRKAKEARRLARLRD